MSERVAVFAEAFLHTSNGKAAHGLIRYGEREVVAVVDSLHAGQAVDEVVPYAGKPVPVVATVAEAAALGAQCLAIGVAPAGGKLPPEWKDALLEALALRDARRGGAARRARPRSRSRRGGLRARARAARPAARARRVSRPRAERDWQCLRGSCTRSGRTARSAR